MVPTWSKHDPDMVSKSKPSIDMYFRSCWLSLVNFLALAGLEVKHGPNMTLILDQKRHSTDMCLRSCWLNHKIFRVLSCLEVEIGQQGPCMVQTWHWDGPRKRRWTWYYGSTKTVLKSLENIRDLPDMKLKLGQTWSKHGQSMALT